MKAHHRMNVVLFLVGSLVAYGLYIAFRYAPPPSGSVTMEAPIPIEVTRSYEYDKNNRLIAVKYSDGTQIRFVYDEYGRMIERKMIHEPKSDVKQVVLN